MNRPKISLFPLWLHVVLDLGREVFIHHSFFLQWYLQRLQPLQHFEHPPIDSTIPYLELTIFLTKVKKIANGKVAEGWMVSTHAFQGKSWYQIVDIDKKKEIEFLKQVEFGRLAFLSNHSLNLLVHSFIVIHPPKVKRAGTRI